MKKSKLNTYPIMNKYEYDELLNSIKEHGFKDDFPIILYEGDILDGWNRYRACKELNIEPIYKDFKGDEEEAIYYVIKSNIRRTLTKEQRILAITRNNKIIEILKKKIKEDGYNKRNTRNQYSEEVDRGVKLPHDPNNLNKSIAKITQSNENYVKKIRSIDNDRPELCDKMIENKIKLSEAEREIKKEKKIEKLKEVTKTYIPSNDIKLIMGDFYNESNIIPDEKVDIIITDPPYPGEYLYLWEQMFEVAQRVLKPSGFLIAYSGHQYLDKIFQMKNDLKYYWIMKLDFTKLPIAQGRNMMVTWKPVIIWQKEPFKILNNTVMDKVQEETKFNYDDRTLHAENWQQGIGNIEWLIETFTEPNDLILEPFAGTGTNLVAAQRLKRRCIGFEIDPQYEEIIKGRLTNNK